MSLPLQSIVSLYAYLLQPIPQLAAYGLPVGILDIVGTLRLALAVKQIKHALRVNAGKGVGKDSSAKKLSTDGDEESALSSIWAMLVIVYGGELFVSSFVSQPPSFFTSPTGPVLITLCHFMITLASKYTPSLLPVQPSLKTELPFAVVDALTRAVLLCSIGPPTILGHKSAAISSSPTALLLTSTVFANGGFFIANSFSMLSPFGWEVSTPPELKPWGWASMDLLSAPSVTALFATLTHSQSLWSNVNTAATQFVGSYTNTTSVFSMDDSDSMVSEKRGPQDGVFDAESARAICALVLVGLFSAKTIRNYGPASLSGFGSRRVKVKGE